LTASVFTILLIELNNAFPSRCEIIIAAGCAEEQNAMRHGKTAQLIDSR
jgi:hypothetical protein